MPARLVHQDKGMRAGCNRLGDLVQVQRHPLGRAARQHQASALAVSRADRAEDVGRRCPLVFRSAGRVPRLAQRRVILFFCPIRASSANQISRGLPPTACRDLLQTGGEVFLKAATAASLFA